MLAKSTSATVTGIDAVKVSIEVDAYNGLPGLEFVGLPETMQRECRERVRSAVKNSGFDWPPRAMVANIECEARPEANHLDLALALASLAALGELPFEVLENRLFVGELGLDGAVRPVRGCLAIAELAHREGFELFVPYRNRGEAEALDGTKVTGVRTLAELVGHLRDDEELLPEPTRLVSTGYAWSAPVRREPDLKDVRGMHAAKRVLEIAAAGGHHLLLIGAPGSGRTMLSRRLPSILPPLADVAALQATKIHSLVAEVPPTGLLEAPPFRSPHPGISTAGMVGGGAIPRPGEVSLAHGGVLFLDEFPEFTRAALESLRQPMEEGFVTVVRTRARHDFPARFNLVAAMNPCPCGHFGMESPECRCSDAFRARYLGRIRRFLPWFDLVLQVPHQDGDRGRGDSSETVAKRVQAARSMQRPRKPDIAAVLRVGRTIADLEGEENIQVHHVTEAATYRQFPVVEGVDE